MHMCMHMHMCMCMCMCAQVAPWAGQASITTGLPFTEGEGYSKGDTPGMGKALELGSTQVRLAQGWVPFVFTTRIPSEGTEALATLQSALNQTVAAVAASGCWMGAGACVVAESLGRQLPSWAQEHRERFEEDAVEALSQDLTPTLRAATAASREDALRERLAKALRRTVARKGVRPPSELCVFSRVLACVHAHRTVALCPVGPHLSWWCACPMPQDGRWSCGWRARVVGGAPAWRGKRGRTPCGAQARY